MLPDSGLNVQVQVEVVRPACGSPRPSPGGSSTRTRPAHASRASAFRASYSSALAVDQHALDDVAHRARARAEVAQHAGLERIVGCRRRGSARARAREAAAQAADLVEPAHALHEQRPGGQVDLVLVQFSLGVEDERAVLRPSSA